MSKLRIVSPTTKCLDMQQCELELDRCTMANKPPTRHSVTARRWCLIFRMLR